MVECKLCNHLLIPLLSVLPAYIADHTPSSEASKEIAKVALKLKYQIEQVVSCEVEEGLLTDPNSHIITDDVVKTSKNAGGEEYAASVVYCLLVCLRWFQIQASNELWDADLHEVRAVACEVIAKRMYVHPLSPYRTFLCPI
jgi:hypothetical protein